MELTGDDIRKILIAADTDDRHAQIFISMDEKKVEVVDSVCYLGYYIGYI